MKAIKRSPLKSKPLRNPGQSLDEQISKIYDDTILPLFVVALFLLILAGMEWVRYIFSLPLTPLLHTVVAVAGIGVVGLKIWRIRPKLTALRLGRDGEKAVGQFLERLREDGYHVYHDLVGNEFNVDHVIIGPAGVFTLETKTISKRQSPNAKVLFDGERVLVDGYPLDRDPVIQAKAQRSWLRGLLQQSTGRTFDVKSILLFPGWFVEQQSGRARELWAVEPKALRAFLQRQPPILIAEEISLASFHISRFIRSEEAQRV